MQTRCSVVIPTFNAAHLIGRQLEALAKQTMVAPFEIIVADNGSTDDLSDVLDAWANRLPYLRRVDASRARGVSVARNVGIAAARSDHILVCDADDEVCPEWVESLVEALSDYGLVGGPVETRSLSGPAASWVPIEDEADALPTFGQVAYPYGGNTGMRRSVFDSVGGYDEDYPAGAEEIDFAWRAAAKGIKAHFVPTAILHYRIRTDLRGVVRQQYNSGRGTARLVSKVCSDRDRGKSWPRRIHHELVLLGRFPWRGGRDARRAWLTVVAFEIGKLVESQRLGIPAP